MSVDLDISNYNLQDILSLFKMPINISKIKNKIKKSKTISKIIL